MNGMKAMKIQGHGRPVSRMRRMFIASPGQMEATAKTVYTTEGASLASKTPRIKLTKTIFQ